MEITPPTEATFETSSPSDAPETILDRVQVIVEDAIEAQQPLEVEPARSRLFEQFATAEAAGFLGEDKPLEADAIARALGQRWGLDQSAQKSAATQEKLADADLAKMRMLWATLRMWMEWEYAWSRWSEFHKAASPNRPR